MVCIVCCARRAATFAPTTMECSANAMRNSRARLTGRVHLSCSCGLSVDLAVSCVWLNDTNQRNQIDRRTSPIILTRPASLARLFRMALAEHSVVVGANVAAHLAQQTMQTIHRMCSPVIWGTAMSYSSHSRGYLGLHA